MNLRNFLEDVGTGGLWVLTATQVENILRIANLVLAIIISLLVLISRLIDWHKKAKADGKITEDEIKEGIDIIKEGTEEIKNHIDENKHGE